MAGYKGDERVVVAIRRSVRYGNVFGCWKPGRKILSENMRLRLDVLVQANGSCKSSVTESC